MFPQDRCSAFRVAAGSDLSALFLSGLFDGAEEEEEENERREGEGGGGEAGLPLLSLGLACRRNSVHKQTLVRGGGEGPRKLVHRKATLLGS